jgi:23S rRNA pseudouridine1911/1915/1917 synthase
VPDRPAGVVSAPVARSSRDRTRMAVARTGHGRHAVTRYKVEARYVGDDGTPLAALVALELETGRTHQVRLHLAHIGHPVIGDPVYAAGFAASVRKLGAKARAVVERLGRQALHAATLGFTHPVTGRRLLFQSALPADMESLRAALSTPGG